jgi:pimeloyl-ACP methyl ester carboxylesterase/predicted glycosyltransferase
VTTTSDETVASASIAGARPREQTRARYPDRTGYVARDGVRVFYETYGSGGPAVLLLPTWSIVHSRVWKAQIPYLSRRCRVITFDGRGNGRSDRPVGAAAYTPAEFAADALAVMDATATERAALVALSSGALWATLLAADHPDRVERIVYIGPGVTLVSNHPERDVSPFEDAVETDPDWAEAGGRLQHDYRGFLEFFFGRCFIEPHSTKQIEDCIGWALETTPQTILETILGIGIPRPELFKETCARVRCPTLVIHGERDLIRPPLQGEALAQATRGEMVMLNGSGHIPLARDPVKVNLLLREFVEGRRRPTSAWMRARSRGRRALYISSPIGLGHAHRDVAIADELRKLHPDLEIDWLAQHPVTKVLEARGERIHPASAELASESGHIESESAEHDLHAFQAIRRMDEIFVANFMVFHDLITAEQYDVWIGDEAWELDYFLHENPELKAAAYVWLTDFVGWLPMADGGARETSLTADYNAEMIEQIARYPRVRDRAVFVGDPDDIVPQRFGPELPAIRDWTEQHYSFAGYVTGFDPAAFADREALRCELGYRPDERVCMVTVGGSGVGADLLRRVIASFAEAKRLIPELRMIAVAGPRIDPGSLPGHDDLDIRAYVPDLYQHLAACDLAIVQGGLTTAMELTANRRPFIYFPLKHHFEQNVHVHHRLSRYGAGRRMEFDESPPDAIAAAIASELGREVDYRPVDSDGAARAAELIAEVL